MFANLNGQKKLSSSEEKGLQKKEVLFAEGNQLSSEDKPEHDGWYRWIDHLVSLEYHKAIEELKTDISELEAEISELKVLISELTHPTERRCQEKLKDDMEKDLKFVKLLADHFNNPEEIITELKRHIDEDKSRESNGYTSRASNRINGHIILVKYFTEETMQKVSAKTMAFMQDIENQDRNQKKRNSWTGREPKKEIESVYTASDKNTAKEYDEVAYDQKLKELRGLIIYAKNNFDDDVCARLLIRVNNCILSNSQHVLNGKNSDLIVNPDEFDYKGTLFFNKNVSQKTQEAFTHAEKLRDCVKELLNINHGNFDQILDDIKDLMEPVLKQSDISRVVNPPQGQNGPETNGDAENETQKESEQPQQKPLVEEEVPTPAANPPQGQNCDAENETQKESKQPQQRAQSVDNAPKKVVLPSSLETAPHKPQNPYDSSGMYCALGTTALGFVLMGVILCATGNPVLGGVFIVVPVISALISALILGIITICEEVSDKKEKDPNMGTWPALIEVLTPKCLSGGKQPGM